jgi:phytoene desaturase
LSRIRRAVVLGGGQAGLSAAIHLRLCGLDVELLEQRDAWGGKAAGISLNGFELDPGPSIIISPWIYSDVFSRAGERMADHLRLRRVDPIFRMVMEDRILDLPPDREGFLSCIQQDESAHRRLFGQLDNVYPLIRDTIFERPFDRPWHLLHPKLIATALPFDIRQSYRQQIDGLFSSPELRALYYGFPSYSGQTYSGQAAGALLVPYLMVEEGVWFPEGGVAAIPAAFAGLARRLGVQMRLQSRVRGLVREAGRIAAVQIEGEADLAADIVISAVDRITAETRWLERRRDLTPSFSYFTLHLGLKKKLEGLRHHTLLVPSDFARGFEQLYGEGLPPDAPVVYLNSTPAPEGCTNLFIVLTVPAMRSHLDWEAEEIRQRDLALEIVRRFGWTWEPDEAVFERMQSPRTFEERDGSWRGSLYGPLGSERLFGLLPLSNEDPEFRNLFYAGGSVQPGAGLPMATLSGRFAAEKAARRFRL